jgi:hypothetical protein|nr:MAG TPA: RecT protein [Caudoviricetes sp.]DAI87501.1 MAG TPA: RecT protein [Caudoviricetes sp.]
MAENGIVVSQPQVSGLNMFANQDSFNTGYKMAQILSASTIIPDTFKGNVGNVMIAIDLAQRIHTNPLMIMQNMSVIYGMPSFSAKFLIACINASGLFATPLRYEFVSEQGKDDWGCYAYAIDKQGEVLKGSTVTIRQAKIKGWYDKKGSNWQADPEQMLRYRAATRFQNAYCPEITCGLAVKEDLEDGDYTEITANNVEQLSAEEKLAQAQQQEEQQANTQSLDMNNGENKEENKAANNSSSEEQKTAQTEENAAQTKPKAEPMGKQEMPDMFKQQ